MNYRPEVDGLRALAVFPVILFHAGLDGFSGGFVGVDVFFVISGFLITSILSNHLDHDKFSIVDFYERRARRILPALFFVMALCLPFAWLLLPPAALTDFSQSVIATVTFSSNIFFWFKSGYFDGAAELKPLLHTWSLAVEEQFYILFPLLLSAIWALSANRRLTILAVIALLSLFFAQYSAYHLPSSGFYLLPSRAWELLVGSMAALYLRTNTGKRRFESKPLLPDQFLSTLGLILIVVAVYNYSSKTPFPSIYAILPVFGTVLVLLFSKPGTISYFILSQRVFVGMGLVSYSAYLWHQPVLVFFRYHQMRDPLIWEITILVAIVFILSYFSWRFIEQPFRKRDEISRQSVFRVSLLASTIALAIGFTGWVLNGVPNRVVPSTSYASSEYTYDNLALQKESWQLLRRKSQDEYYRVEDNSFDRALWFEKADPRTRMLIVGNSHSKDMYNLLSFSESAAKNFQIARFGTQLTNIANSEADFYLTPNYKEADVVVICTKFLDSADVDSIRDVHSNVIADGKKLVVVNQTFSFHDLHQWTKMDQILRTIRNDVNLRTNKPALRDLINRMHFEDFVNLRTSNPHGLTQRQQIRRVASELGILLVDRMDLVCNYTTEFCFATSDGFQKNFYDSHHYTLVGAEVFGARADEIGWLDDFPRREK